MPQKKEHDALWTVYYSTFFRNPTQETRRHDVRVHPILIVVATMMVLAFSSVCYGQKLDTSSQSAYNGSLVKVFKNLSPDRQLEFEAFFYCLLDEGKPLVRVSKLKGIAEIQEYYPIVEAMEQEGKIKFNGLTADEVIAQGKSLLIASLKQKIEEAKDEAQVNNLKAQLAIIEKKELTREDLEAYTKLRG